MRAWPLVSFENRDETFVMLPRRRLRRPAGAEQPNGNEVNLRDMRQEHQALRPTGSTLREVGSPHASGGVSLP